MTNHTDTTGLGQDRLEANQVPCQLSTSEAGPRWSAHMDGRVWRVCTDPDASWDGTHHPGREENGGGGGGG